MADVFSTEDVGQVQDTPVGIRQGVQPAQDTFGQLVTGLAVEAGLETVAQTAIGDQTRALEDVQNQRNDEIGEMRTRLVEQKFSALEEATRQGLPTSQANIKARAILAQTKAEVPWISDRVDASFKNFFGGSAKGFEETSEEKAARETYETILNKAALNNVNLTEAQSMVLEEQAVINTQRQLDYLKNTQSLVYERDVVPYQHQLFAAADHDLDSAYRQLIDKSTGTLTPDNLQSFNLLLNEKVKQIVSSLRSEVFPDGQTPFVTNTQYNQILSDIENYKKEWEGIVTNSDALLLNENLDKLETTNERRVGRFLMPAVSMGNAVGGAPVVEAIFKAASNPKHLSVLTAQNPEMGVLFTKDGNLRRNFAISIANGMGQGVINTRAGVSLEEANRNGGYAATQIARRDSENSALGEGSWNASSSDNPEQAAVARAYNRGAGNLEPVETAKTLISPAFKDYGAREKDKAIVVFADSLDGMRANVIEHTVRAGLGAPKNIQVETVGQFKLNISTQEGVTLPEQANESISWQYRVLKENPLLVQEAEQILGIPLEPVDVLNLHLNDSVPDYLVDRIKEQEKEGAFEGKYLRDLKQRASRLKLAQKAGQNSTIFRWLQKPVLDELEVKLKEVAASETRGMVQTKPLATPPTEGDLTPEEMTAAPELHPDDVSWIKAGKSLEEKKRRAERLGIPLDMIEKATRGQ